MIVQKKKKKILVIFKSDCFLMVSNVNLGITGVAKDYI